MAAADRSPASLFRELKRRRVIQTCIYYAILCWVLLQVGDIVFPALGLDEDQASRVLLFVVILGFPVTFIFAWYFQITPRGVVRTRSFVERRVLNNMTPINDRRHAKAATYFHSDKAEDAYYWILSAETGPLTGLNFGVSEPIEIGRSLDCNVAVVSPHVSRHHARIEPEGDKLFVVDLGSANGTVLNGKKIQGREALRHEDELRLHDIIFRVLENFSRPRRKEDTLNQTTIIGPARSITSEINDEQLGDDNPQT